MHSYLDAADTLPLALVISVPLVSLTLLCLLVGSAVCLKRALPAAAAAAGPAGPGEGKKGSTAAMTTATTNSSSSSSSSSSSPLPKLPHVVLNPLAQPSPYATSHLVSWDAPFTNLLVFLYPFLECTADRLLYGQFYGFGWTKSWTIYPICSV